MSFKIGVWVFKKSWQVPKSGRRIRRARTDVKGKRRKRNSGKTGKSET